MPLLTTPVAAEPTSADPVEILVVVNGGEIHDRILTAARDELTALGRRARLQPVRGNELTAALARSDAAARVVTLGNREARDLQDLIPVPVLHAAIPAELYPARLSSAEPDLHPHGHSALFLDQPATRQIEAIHLALPQLQRLGALLSPGLEPKLEPLRAAAYVEAGALLAVHADAEAIGQDLGEAIAQFIDHGRLEPPRHVRRFAIAVNHNVARSLGLNLPTAQELLKSLQQSEAQR